MKSIALSLAVLLLPPPSTAQNGPGRRAQNNESYEVPAELPPANPVAVPVGPFPFVAVNPLQAPMPSASATPGSENQFPPDPVHLPNLYLHSGEFHLSVVDLHIRGRGLDFVWARKYRSRRGPSTAMGHGWDFSYNLCVEVLPGPLGPGGLPQTVRVRDGNTRAELYSLRPGGVYTRNGSFREGRFDGEGRFVLKFRDGGTWTFHSMDGRVEGGKIQNITDRNNNMLQFFYDGSARLTMVRDTLGRDILIAYGADGMLDSVTDFTGRQVLYDHYIQGDADGSPGDLRSVRSPTVTGTPNGNDFPAGKTTTYRYSTGHTKERLNHNLLAVIDPGSVVRIGNTYHDTEDEADPNFDRLKEQHRGDPSQRIQLVRFEEFRRHDAKSQGPTILTIVNDRCGNVRDYLFDLPGRCLRVRKYTGRADPTRPTTRKTNRPTIPLRSTDPQFFETCYEYNEDDLITQKTNPGGNLTRWIYEHSPTCRAEAMNIRKIKHLPGSYEPRGDHGKLVQLFEYLGGFGGQEFVTLHTDAGRHTTQHAYDARGNRLESSSLLPAVRESFKYNAFGQLVVHLVPENGGERREDLYTYWQPSDGPVNGYLHEHIVDAKSLSLTTTFFPDELGRNTRVVQPGGEDRNTVFNELDQIVREESPTIRIRSGKKFRYHTDYFYDLSDQLVQVDELNFSDLGGDPNKYWSTYFEYDARRLLILRREEVEENREIVTAFEYDANGNRTLIALGEATNGNQPGNVVRTAFDERDLPYRETRGEQSSTQWDYGLNRNLVRIAQGMENQPRVTSMTWDAHGRLVETVDPMGNREELHHDANGNLLQRDLYGEIVDVEGSKANTLLYQASFEYDEVDRVTRWGKLHFDPIAGIKLGKGESVFTYEYAGHRDPLAYVDDNGSRTEFVYDTALRQISLLGPLGHEIRLSYYSSSNLRSRTEEHRSDGKLGDQTVVTLYGYDDLGRRTREVDNAGQRTSFEYDSRDNQVWHEDALGNETRWVYDGLRRLITKVRDLDGDGADPLDPDDIITQQEFDDSSRVTSRSDDGGHTTRYAYDELNRQVATTYADGTSETTVYDIHDNRVVTTDANQTSVKSSFDLLNRLVGTTVSPGPGVSSDTTFERFDHDGLSHLVAAEDDDSLVTRTHDSLSNMLTEIQDGETLLMSWDGMGNLTQATYPSGKQLNWTYDALHRKKSVANGLIIATWNYIGPRTETRYYPTIPNAESRYIYDSAQRVAEIHHKAFRSEVNVQLNTFDALGNRTVMVDATPGGSAGHSWHSTYDSAHRLTRSDRLDAAGKLLQRSSYLIDGINNRLDVSGDVDPGQYSLVGEDRKVNQYTATPFDKRTYDDAGNLTMMDQVTMTYDFRNRMVEYHNPDVGGSPLTMFYRYDAFGRRIETSDGELVTRYSYIGGQVCEEKSKECVIREFVYGLHADEVLMMESDHTKHYFYFQDELGTVRTVVCSEDARFERYEYDDFGNPHIFDEKGTELPSSMFNNPCMFAGRRYDEHTGLYYNRSRYLEPRTGRFTSRDVLGLWGDPGNLGNPTAYVGNNPQSQSDPYGLSPTLPLPPPSRTVWANRINPSVFASSIRSFNPAPPPPMQLQAEAAGNGGLFRTGRVEEPPPERDSHPFLAPWVAVIFNPQPEPPALGILPPFVPQGPFNTLSNPPSTSSAPPFISPWMARAFNPQPEPPALGSMPPAFFGGAGARGIIIVNGQPDFGGSSRGIIVIENRPGGRSGDSRGIIIVNGRSNFGGGSQGIIIINGKTQWR